MLRTSHVIKNCHIPEHTVNKNRKATKGTEGISYVDSVTVPVHKNLSTIFWLYPQGITSSVCLVKDPLFLLALLHHQTGWPCLWAVSHLSVWFISLQNSEAGKPQPPAGILYQGPLSINKLFFFHGF